MNIKISYCDYDPHPEDGKDNIHLRGPGCTGNVIEKNYKLCDISTPISIVPSETESPESNGGGTNNIGGGGNGVATNAITPNPCVEAEKIGLINSRGNCINASATSYNSAPFLDLVNNLPSAQRLYLDDIRNIQIRRDLEDFFRKEAYSQEAKIKVEATISILPTLEELKNYWPKNAEEWKVFGELVVEAMIAIIPDLIPVVSELNSLKNSISAFKSGNYLDGSTELGSAIIGVIPVGKVLKAGGKLITLIKTSVTVFKKVRPFIGKLAKVLKKGFKTKIADDVVQLTDKAGNVVAKGADEVADTLVDLTRKTSSVVNNKLTTTLSNTVKKNLDDALENGDVIAEIVEDTVEEIAEATVKKGSKLSWPEVKALFKRGNDFNKKAATKYRYNEIHLKNGKRLDSYIPGQEIVSRKATDLNKIKPSTFESYLKELTTKYKKGTTIRSNKYKSGSGAIDGQTLSGDYFLEIPSSNRVFYEASTTFKNLANQYGVKIKYLAE